MGTQKGIIMEEGQNRGARQANYQITKEKLFKELDKIIKLLEIIAKQRKKWWEFWK